jgi:carbon storage regulator CsrA
MWGRAGPFSTARTGRSDVLLLTRKCGERVVIGEGDGRVEVLVVSASRGLVKLGFTAKRDVLILRRELLDRKQNETTPPPLGEG